MNLSLRAMLERWRREIRVRRFSALRLRSERNLRERARFLAARNLFDPAERTSPQHR